jgi:hypothetical protein
VLFAQHDDYDKRSWQKIFGFSATGGLVVVHTNSVENTQGTKTAGFSLQYATQMNDKETYNRTGCYPINGINFSYFHFTKKLLGDGFSLDYFLQPVYKLSDKWQFQMKGAAGLCYLTNPYDSVKNPTNKNYSTHFNAHFDIGAGFGYHVTDHILIQGNGELQHLSNGAFKHPNAGINWISGSLSIIYYPDNNNLVTYSRVKPKDWQNKKPWFDVGAYYVPSQGFYYNWQATRNYAAGLYTQVSKQVSNIDDINFMVEAYYNDITVKQSNIHYDNNNSSLIAGIAAGHDFIFGRVFFSQQIGVYITKKPSYYPSIYQRYGLSYLFSKHFLAGFNLKAHGDEADFADLRITYRL